MTEDMAFGIVYVAATVGGLTLLFLLCEGFFNLMYLMYRFIPAFRRRIDMLFEYPQQWDDD